MSEISARVFANTSSWMVRGIYLACAVFVFLFVASVFLVLDYSVYQANKFGLSTERKLVQQQFQHQIDEVVKYQAELSFRDETVKEVRAPSFSDGFIQRRIHDWLWADFGFSWIVFSEAGHQTKLAVNNGEAVAPDKADSLLFWMDDLVYEANQSYWAALKPEKDGFRLRMVEGDRDQLSAPLPYIHAADMRMVDGRMSIVVAQAVVPKSLFIPRGSEQPTIMVTVKPISEKMFASMSRRLAVEDLHVVADEENKNRPDAYTPVGKGFTDGPFLVAWSPNAPGPFIWKSAMPKVAILSLLAALSMGFIAWRFGAVVRALQKSEATNRFLAKHDALTGLANRIAFEESLTAMMAEHPEGPIAVLAVDLDKFKSVNDQHGHAAGDAVLKAVAARFSDRVGDTGLVARLGGDEFMVLIPNANETTIMALAAGLVIDAQVPIVFNDLLLQVGGSAGAAIFPRDGHNIRNFVHAADMALYAAKNSGRNRAVLYEGDAIMRPNTAAA